MNSLPRLLVIDNSAVLYGLLVEHASESFLLSLNLIGHNEISQLPLDPPDIILYVEMPGRSATETLSAFREIPEFRDIPTLVLLADTAAGQVLRSSDQSNATVAAKQTFLQDLLLPRLRELLTRKHAGEFHEALQFAELAQPQISTTVELIALCRDFAHCL